jgi:hypothetical protein
MVLLSPLVWKRPSAAMKPEKRSVLWAFCAIRRRQLCRGISPLTFGAWQWGDPATTTLAHCLLRRYLP